MKRLVLCFDGTWNRPADEGSTVETNVHRFHRSVQDAGPDGVPQSSWYHPGIGTGGGIDHWTGGVLGAGLDDLILDGYRHLSDAYADGDEVYVLGFSRGAYAARSLVGLVRNCGLLRPGARTGLALMAYGIYRTRGDGPDSVTARIFRALNGREIRVRFLGVWDTVGALGIPRDVADRVPLVGRANLALYEFHDTRLSRIVDRAYHAAAVDEHRRDYDVTLWDGPTEPGQVMEQRWFAGAHADVGGGYAARDLSDLALRWMQDRAAAAGLGVALVEPGPEAHRGVLADSYAAFLGGGYRLLNPNRYLRPVLGTAAGNEVLDPSVGARRGADAGYRPANPGLPALDE
jgi:uncharacterized protein (DUF2235 family)